MENYTWNYIQKNPKQTKRLLGIDYQKLEQLIELGKLLNKRKQEEMEKTKIRINQAGVGNHPKLLESEQIVLMLVYLRHHLSFKLLGLIFKISESTAHNILTYWQKLFENDLPPSLLSQVKKLQKEELISEQLENYELIVDSTKQSIERPSDYQEQKKYYCGATPVGFPDLGNAHQETGKQKRHTFKNQFIVLPKAKVRFPH
ncbi:transposase [Moorena producens JHB]|uniref:Transposase n=1 Tax=Moorena producens (strain JHB) TaxID=1454205 RepID=A0A9Q9SU92_MOOP1|nr:transposase [Moorena producens]WAN69759.1 transposase [Moorena producens JHB]